jgi:hypothetical protein
MKLKPLALAVVVALGLAGLAEARSALSSPSPERVLSIAAQRLALSPSQQAKLLPLVERGVALRAQIRKDSDTAIAAARNELARPDANLTALSADHQTLVDARLSDVRALRDDLLTFYMRDLNPDQQAKARVALLKRIDRLDRIRTGLLSLREDPGFSL